MALPHGFQLFSGEQLNEAIEAGAGQPGPPGPPGDVGPPGPQGPTGKIVMGGVPATSTSSGVVGSMAADTEYLYVCTATNKWVRVALVAW